MATDMRAVKDRINYIGMNGRGWFTRTISRDGRVYRTVTIKVFYQ